MGSRMMLDDLAVAAQRRLVAGAAERGWQAAQARPARPLVARDLVRRAGGAWFLLRAVAARGGRLRPAAPARPAPALER